MRIMIAFNRDELNALQFPVLVSSWDRVLSSSRKRKLYNETFTETERDLITRYYKLFYDWYLRRGTPEEHVMRGSTYNLLQRAVQFFATN